MGKKPFNPRESYTFESEKDSIQVIIDIWLLTFKAQVIFYE